MTTGGTVVHLNCLDSS